MRDTFPLLLQTDFPPLTRGKLDTLQANLGYRCNQACLHCHVAASPKRTEEMSWETMTRSSICPATADQKHSLTGAPMNHTAIWCAPPRDAGD
jgi:hypothetical protein